MDATTITLEELENKYDELGLINKKQEKRVRYIETQTTIIVIAYIFFQVIIFLSNNIIISSANHIRIYCERNWWVPFILSLLITVPFGIAFIAKIHEWNCTIYEFDMNLAGRELIYNKMFSLRKRRNQSSDGINSSSSSSERYYSNSKTLVYKPDVVKLYKRNAFIYATAFALLGYTVVIMTACVQSRTLCHGDA